MRLSTSAATLLLAAAPARVYSWPASTAATAPCTSPIVSGQVPVLLNGTQQTWSVVASGGATEGILVSKDGSFTVLHNYRGYLVSGCPQAFSGDMYTPSFPMLGTVLNYTVDLSTVGCACNAAFYATAMPAYYPNGTVAPGQSGDSYCDANDVGGFWCVEEDIMEANTAAFQCTPHKCDPPVGHYYPSCDKSGCGLNTYKESPSYYGPGAAYSIDTTQPFTVSTAFAADPTTGQLASITTTLTQPSRGPAAKVVMTNTAASCGGPSYLATMSAAMGGGMVPVFSVWGDSAATMKWLDQPPCSNTTACDGASARMVISDISLQPLV